jgi:type IX secretion system PorP/SprF family membrane protein
MISKICKMRIRINFFIVLTTYFLIKMTFVHAQDFIFSQYQYTPLNINPAINTDDIQVIANYHQNRLWETLDMQNYQLSVLYPLNITKDERTPQGLGLSLMYDNTGNRGLISCTGGTFGFSQGVRLSPACLLSAGLSASYYLFNNDYPGNYSTGSQWVDGYGLNQSLGINEQVNYETFHLFSIGAGVNMKFRNKSVSRGDVGFALYHLNKPQYSFLKESSEKLKTKYIFYGKYQVFRNNNFAIIPRALFLYQNVSMLSLGTLLSYTYKNENPFSLIRNCNFQLGLDYRDDHSGVISFNIEQPRYVIGLSYAMGLSSRDVYVNYKSNFELVLAFKLFKNRKRHTRSEYTLGDTRLIIDNSVEKNASVEPAAKIEGDNYNSDTIVVSGEKYELNLRQDFKFKFNDATLSPDNYPYLNELVTLLEQNPRLKVEVIGHTDDVGTDEANKIVSERRAKVVIDYLLSKGIKPNRLKLTYKGKTEPLVPNDSEANRSKNRRVEFKIYND